MKEYKQEFITFLLETGALKFGEFTLKSGRISPYFINTGMFKDEKSIAKLSAFYAQTIKDNISRFDVLFGPAYKGIPLCVSTAMSLMKDHDINVSYVFNRKEVKDYADKSAIVGQEMTSATSIVLIDDVITSGKAIKETFDILKNIGNPQVKAIVISVDRQEKGKDTELSAIQQVEKDHAVKVIPIITLSDIIEFAHNKKINGKVYLNDEMKQRIDDYQEQYGAQ